jgi:hypothetical protein
MAVATITGTGLNLATAANNFTIAIIDYLGATTLYATNISRSTLISGYNVTINPGDVTIRATSTGVCGSSADVDVSTLALQTYRPSPVEGTTFAGEPYSFDVGGGRDGSPGAYELVLGDTIVYPFMNETDFTLTHVSTVGGLSTGPFLAGTLGTRIVGSTTLELFGETRTNYTLDQTLNTSTYRVTYNPNGLSRDFNFYWVTGL